MDISLKEDAVRPVIAKAILDSLTPEVRDELLRKSISGLLEPTQGSYGSKNPSILENAFRQAAQWNAERIVRDVLAEDSPQSALFKQTVLAALDKALADQSLVEHIASAVVKALKPY